MTQFTSFVAVEEMMVTDGGQPRRIDVPVEVPEGTTCPSDSEEFAVVSNLSALSLMTTSIVRGTIEPGRSCS